VSRLAWIAVSAALHAAVAIELGTFTFAFRERGERVPEPPLVELTEWRIRPPEEPSERARQPAATPSGEPTGTDVVLEALRWLARHQRRDGSWSGAGPACCRPAAGTPDSDVGVTGLALLAFLGAGYSHLSKDAYDGIRFGDTVRRSLERLMTLQEAEGGIGARGVEKPMVPHLVAALALTEAYSLTGSGLLKDPARKAVEFALAGRNPGKGWLYGPKWGDNESAVTAWGVRLLESPRDAEFAVPLEAFEGARAWFDEMTCMDGRVYDTWACTPRRFTFEDCGESHETSTAATLVARLLMGTDRQDPLLRAGANHVLRRAPGTDDFLFLHFATLALFRLDGPGGPAWTAWRVPMKDALVGSQNGPDSGCRRGSWEPIDRWSPEGGRVYTTAINALTLEVYYRRPSCQWVSVPKR
jgi:hypothetical protein